MVDAASCRAFMGWGTGPLCRLAARDDHTRRPHVAGPPFLYFRFTQDTPDGQPFAHRTGAKALGKRLGTYRIWVLFLLTGACFGWRSLVDNVAALYFTDSFHLTLKTAGLIAGSIRNDEHLARALGGIFGDWGGKPLGSAGSLVICWGWCSWLRDWL